jgi:hypothetical protein
MLANSVRCLAVLETFNSIGLVFFSGVQGNCRSLLLLHHFTEVFLSHALSILVIVIVASCYAHHTFVTIYLSGVLLMISWKSDRWCSFSLLSVSIVASCYAQNCQQT